MALTKAQLEERRTGIGGSDAATVLGINPFTTAYELYLDKLGEAQSPASQPSNTLEGTPLYACQH
jgi:predicted phage-related endonuclease